KGEGTDIKIPLVRVQTTTFLSVISSFGVMNVKVKRLYEVPSSKRKVSGTSNAIKNTGTITSYYFNVIGYHEQVRVV
ncbi:hypothetical protein BDF21DRAFT_332519, partial [Thamnidium elegans]